jgi:hypothetical protein
LRETIVNCQDPAFGNLLWPKSIASTVNEEIICADRFEHRLIVFNREFMFKYQIGCRGRVQGQFNEPVDLLMTELGYLYVADKNNHRVQIFREAKKYKVSKVKLPKLKFIEEDDEENYDPFSPIKSILKMTTKATERPKSFKAGTEFLFTDEFYLKDKPIKLVTAPLASILAVSTENGFIFIVNEYNDIVNFLKLSEANMGDLRNACLTDFGNELILVCSRRDEVNLKFYKLDVENGNYDDAYLASSPSKKQERPKTDVVEKMKLISKRQLQKNYLPGISLRRIGYVKLTLDMKNLLIYDAINLCLLEYDLNGEFKRIVLRAGNHLSNLMALDFSSDRQHLVTAEVELREKKVDFDEPTLEEIYENEDPHAHEHLTKMKTRSKMYTFKLKTIRYQDCPCHRTLTSAKHRQSRISESNNDASKKEKVVNHSSFSFYNDMFVFD